MNCNGQQDNKQRQTAPDAEFAEADIGNGQRLVKQHGADIRYIDKWKKWIVWNGTQWRIDDNAAIRQMAKDTAINLLREAAKISNDGNRLEFIKHAKNSAMAPRVKAMIEMAQSEVGISIKHLVLDKDVWLLNCPNGTLNLKTGELQPHAHEDMITKCSPVEYQAGAECPVWLKFLDRIFDSNRNLIDFMQRLLGYCLTGSVREQIMPIFWGSGANGKSTLIETMFSVMGEDYAIKLPASMLMQSKSQRHPTEIADLRGIRFTAAVESEDGKKLAEGLVKDLTGRDTLAGRHVFKDFSRFKPTHKIAMATNHRPVISGTDHAIWRRLKIVPFTVQIPDHEQDRDLPEKLLAELPGILTWAVQGCLAWQQHGLGMPDAIAEATDGYRNDQDEIGKFIKEHCIISNACKVKASDLFDAYRKQTDQPITQRLFGKTLTERGFDRVKSNGVWYRGLGLLTEHQTEHGTMEPCGPFF